MWVIYCVCISLSKHMCSCGHCIYECIFKCTCGVCVMSPWGDTKIRCTPTLKQANSERENKCDKTERWKGEKGRRGISKSSRCKNSLEGEKETSKKNNIKKRKGTDLEIKPTIPFFFSIRCCMFDRYTNVYVPLCVPTSANWPFPLQSLWVDCIALSYSSAFWPKYCPALTLTQL